MCGLAGLLRLDAGPPPARELLVRMAGALRHRGPDEFGLYRDRRVGLAHARLSIVDLASGQQPLANETNDVWIAYNGEVFNFVELREELLARGHVFRTRSDTEVIVHAYETWGDRCVERMNGQFAFALWDGARRRLLLARDRLGVRPLFWAEAEGELVFASEVKALFQHPGVRRAVSPAGLAQVFTFWSTVPPRTPFEGVHELPPGHLLAFELEGGRRLTRYWQPSYPPAGAPPRLTLEEAEGELEARLRRATLLRLLRADVPVGCYLSGGLDSSVVAALAREASPAALRTFSLRFADAEFDEGRFQRLMVERLGTDHTEVVVRREDIAESFERCIYHTERPVLRAAPAPLLLLSRLVHENGLKVVLTGEGSDEMLAGYDLFREAKVRRFWARHPGSRLRPRLLDRLYPYLARSPRASREMAWRFFAVGLAEPDARDFSHRPRWQAASALQRLFSMDLRATVARSDVVRELLDSLPAEFSSWDPLCRAQCLEVMTLLSGYLLASQGDRVLMASSVEGRFPFLDLDVVTFANSLPPSYKLRVLDEKHLLKRVARRLCPPEIVSRPKQPYRAPDAVSFLGSRTPAYVAELLSEGALRGAGLFDAAAVSRLVVKCRAAATDGAPLANADNMALLGVLSTQLVVHHFIRRPPSHGPPVPIRTDVDRSAER